MTELPPSAAMLAIASVQCVILGRTGRALDALSRRLSALEGRQGAKRWKLG